MDIPYTVQPRRDTGLYNAKVGIWLFLASEVMLFGALFSSYILLRVSARDGLWPLGWLNVPLGTLNTLVLITSSITTVMAWASLKMNNFGKFKLFHAITLLCALMFLGIKSYEYHDKFTHYQIDLKDGTFADGHIVKNGLKQETPGVYSGTITIKGHVATEEEIYDPHHHGTAAQQHDKTAAQASATEAEHHEEHKELTFEGAQIKKLSNYGPWHNTYTAIYFTLTGLHALHVIGGALVIAFLWGPGSKMWKTEPERFTNRIEISGLFWHFVDLVWIFLFPVLYLL
jgi:cytochrome c oxidase subunit 3